MRTNTNQAGFTLVEALICMSTFLILLSVGVPLVGSIRDDKQAQEIIDCAARLRPACAAYMRDQGHCASEFSQVGDSYAAAVFHQLSAVQDADGWRGPYLEKPLSKADNPRGAAVYLHSDLSLSPARGFDLNGDGQVDALKAGQFVVFHGIPKRLAKLVDLELDKAVRQSDANWQDRGRVEWVSLGGGSLSIYLSSGALKR